MCLIVSQYVTIVQFLAQFWVFANVTFFCKPLIGISLTRSNVTKTVLCFLHYAFWSVFFYVAESFCLVHFRFCKVFIISVEPKSGMSKNTPNVRSKSPNYLSSLRWSSASNYFFTTTKTVIKITIILTPHACLTRSPAWPLEGASRRATAQPHGAMWF